jgi:CRISPR-associated protein Cmr4
MNSTNAILGLFTETSLHAGAGQALGVIDLPIQREAHTAWPCVYGSAVKGALRARAEMAHLENLLPIFGPTLTQQGAKAEYAGALSVGDARLLLLPVRSLTTHFRWVTCPAALRRLQRDAERLRVEPLRCFEVPEVAADMALVAAEGGGGQLFLEEYRFTVTPTDLSAILEALSRLMPEGLRMTWERQFTVVADDAFRHLAEHATPVTAHVRLNENKTVARGALWYEETLPPETLLYAAVNAVDARTAGFELAASSILAQVREGLFGANPYLQLGGNETVGMGWCRVAMLGSGEM